MKNLFTLFTQRKGLPGRVSQLAAGKTPRFSSAFPPLNEWYRYDSRSSFYRYMRNRIPIISSAVWNWVRLCNTPGDYHLVGHDSHCREAEAVIDDLIERICGVIGLKRKGMGSLLELFFLEVFTNGNFCGRLVPLPSGRGIDYFEDLDAESIDWTRSGRWIPRLKRDDRLYALDAGLFVHYGLGADRMHPAGVSFLSSIEFVTQIEQRIVDDMAKSSHNAGYPHLHIKITPPERFENESDTRYIKRAENYFDDTVGMFKQIDADDNIFSWSDLEVSVIGGERTMPTSWKLNREQVIEDVITGMKLFPWVVGRSHGTTKNWVQAQFNLLMQEVDSIQKAVADWILNLELKLRNIPVKAEYVFSPNQDPYELDREKAASLRLETVDQKVRRGYISKNEGAKELGYQYSFQPG